jgi:hypothetical protein
VVTAAAAAAAAMSAADASAALAEAKANATVAARAARAATSFGPPRVTSSLHYKDGCVRSDACSCIVMWSLVR